MLLFFSETQNTMVFFQGNYELYVKFDFKGQSYYAAYGSFRVSGESDDFRLHVDSHRGTAGDSLKYHNGMKFTTKVR